MRLTRAEIADLIPHAGRMVLLDAVVEWDDAHIVCQTSMHQDRGNPLTVGGQLSAVCGIEFAAQAMAVHGALLMRTAAAIEDGTTRPRAGFLASVRSVELHVDRLDDVRGVVAITATREAGDAENVLYRFELRAGELSLVTGRATVVLAMSEPAR